MGYRSNIYIAISKEVLLKTIIADNLPKLLAEVDPIKMPNAYYYECHQYKWYSGYPAVDEVDTFLANLEDKEYGFIIVGDDTNDIETKGCPWEYDLKITRKIHKPY